MPPVTVDRDYVVEALAALVRINSINPTFSGGTTDERLIAHHVARECAALGMDTTFSEPEPNRVSVLARLRGRGGGRSLLLYGHHDTVAVDGMESPFEPKIRDGKMFGRGTYDMKSGLAACLGAVKAIRDAGASLAGDLFIASVADEEVASIGMSDVLTRIRPDAAIVTESTELRLCLAHKGFCWIEVETFGRAAHGSRFTEGIDANMRMGRVLGGLDELEQRLRRSSPHPLVGPPSLHAAVIKGGSGTSTYAAHCRLEIERRTIPGETEAKVVGEIQEIVDRLAGEDPTFRARVRPFLTRDSFEVSGDAAIARAVQHGAASVLGEAPVMIGEPYWMDAALLAAAGVETAVIGPKGAGAHAVEEWVELDSVVDLTKILATAAEEYTGRR